jgi:frataxin-like iron-binding protein CyaY
MNQANLQRITESLEKIISQFSSDPNTKKIYLFLSVQSTLAIEIGRKFQEGMHKVWVIHNFNTVVFTKCYMTGHWNCQRMV